LTITRSGSKETRRQTLFDYLDEQLHQNRGKPGGFVGYLGYELRADCGSPVTHDSPFPDAMLMRVEKFESGEFPAPELQTTGISPQTRLSREEYIERIQECIALMKRGESYELCLTNQIAFDTDVSGLAYYAALRKVNPAPYSAYLRFSDLGFSDLEIACSS